MMKIDPGNNPQIVILKLIEKYFDAFVRRKIRRRVIEIRIVLVYICAFPSFRIFYVRELMT